MFENTFECKFNSAKEWQKQRYLRLAEHFKGIELSDEDKRYLLWLSGQDEDTERVLSSLFDRLKKGVAASEVPVQKQPKININRLRVKNGLKPIQNGDIDFISKE